MVQQLSTTTSNPIPQPTPLPIDCAANFGSTTPSDGTLGTVPAKYVCPESLPVCKDYQYNKKWGNCVAAPPTAHSVLYSCNNYYQCKEDPNGKFKSLHECNKHCYPKYKCHTNDDGTTECIIAYDGKYKSVKECQEKCKSKYICDRDEKNQPSCKISTKGNFNSLTECQTQCQAKYTCDPKTNVCRMDDKGTLDLESCQQQCKPKYSCDTKKYVCAIDNLTGKYSSSRECTNECRRPLIIPQETITQAAFNEEIAQTKTLKGSLNSSNIRFDSISIQHTVYIILIILILGLIFYYMTNKIDNLFATIIGIVGVGLLIYMIVVYVYTHYTPDTSSFRF